MPRSLVAIHVGTSGWLYAPWRGSFYPPGLRHADELAWTSRRVGSVEVNGTFYSLQRPSCFRAWRAATPPGFQIAIKGSRFITHMKRLRDVDTALANFFASGLLALGDKLGPILWQFPAAMPLDEPRFAAFLALLPRTLRDAARLARRHDGIVEGRSFVRATLDRPLRHAFEVRHPSFFCESFVGLLRRHGAALVVSDGAARWPLVEDVTADFVYVRLHGAEELYVSGYRGDDLDRWADRVARWREGRAPPRGARLVSRIPPPRASGGRDVYVYFDNDAKVHAPFDAMGLMDRLGVTPADAGGAPLPRIRRAA